MNHFSRLLTRRRWLGTAVRRCATTVVAGAAALSLGAGLAAPPPATAATRQDVELSFTAAGLDYGRTPAYADYAGTARRLGVDVGTHVDGRDIDRIVAAAWDASLERFATAGIGVGDRPDLSDITDGAARFGLGFGSGLDPDDVEAVLAAGRAEVARAFDAAGFDYGTFLDASDIVAASKRLGVNIGQALDPQDTRRVVDALWLRVSSPLLANAAGVRLYSPSPKAAHVGFHQASSGSSAAMRAQFGSKMPSRGRGTPGTSAVDVALDAGDPVRAPVSGRVVEVRNYALYGKYPDVRIRMVPDDNPGMLVTVLHVTDPKVRVGQRIRGGADLLAGGARKLPFWSQIDGLGGGGRGHVHLELRRR